MAGELVSAPFDTRQRQVPTASRFTSKAEALLSRSSNRSNRRKSACARRCAHSRSCVWFCHGTPGQCYHATTQSSLNSDVRILTPSTKMLKLHRLHVKFSITSPGHRKEDTSPNEEVSGTGTGWRSHGSPMVVRVGLTSRALCGGQSLASPGGWPVNDRPYPASRACQAVTSQFWKFSELVGTPQLFLQLATGKVENCPCDLDSIRQPKQHFGRTC